MTAYNPWTQERVALLNKLIQDGASYSEIAAKLGGGITRNAAIGKAKRLGVSDSKPRAWSAPRRKRNGDAVLAQAIQHRAAGLSQREKPHNPRGWRGNTIRQPLRSRFAFNPSVARRADAPPVDDAELRELAPNRSDCAVAFPRQSLFACCWPLWDDSVAVSERQVCGAPVVTESYCARHARIAQARS